MFVTDMDMNTVELFDDVADGEWCQISQPTVRCPRDVDIKRYFLKGNPIW